jgi:hypothetical protein
MCKQCIASGDNAEHIKKDCLIPARAITGVGGNKIFAEDVVYMLVSNPKTYTKAMVGFYEKLDDATTLVKVTNDLSNNWTD